MTVEIRTVEKADEWNQFVSSRPEANFLQAWQWGDFHQARGKKIVRRGVYKKDKLVAVYTGVVETARRGTHLAIAGGPLVDWHDKELVDALVADMRKQGLALGCVFVRSGRNTSDHLNHWLYLPN